MKYLKIIAGILATILLGAVGGGLWERVLSPALDKLSRAAIQLVDGIYKDTWIQYTKQLLMIFQIFINKK